MEYPKPNLEQRVRDTLDANFPEWIWNLKPGSKIAVETYQGSWTQPGTQLWYEQIFICISGNKVFYIGTEAPMFIRSTEYADGIKPMEEFAVINAELNDYRKAHPNWQNEGM